MSNAWQWDDSLFAGAARYYEQGRLPYAEGLPDAFREALAADGKGRLLEVGCGPGSIALRLTGIYRGVVGVDPDHGMIREARRLTAGRRITNATFVQARAEALPADLGAFDAVTFASSFHWMDRERVAAIVHEMLTPTGVVVQINTIGNPEEAPAGRYPPPPRQAIKALVHQYLGEKRRAGQSTGFVSPSNEDDIWRAAGYLGPEKVLVPDGRALNRSTDDVIAGTLSMSSSAPHLFGDQLDAFRSDLLAVLRTASPTGNFTVALPDTELKIWRTE